MADSEITEAVAARFSHVVRIWLEKPHVACPTVFGAKRLHSCSSSSSQSKDEFSQQKEQQLDSAAPVGIRFRLRRQLLHNDLSVAPLTESVEFVDSWTVDFVTSESDQPLYRIALDSPGSNSSSNNNSNSSSQISVSAGRQPTALELRYYTAEWLESSLQAKLNHWLSQECQQSPDSQLSRSPPSLCNVDLALYQATYYRLKSTYGPGLVANWSERTNPEKFVYEDCGIAAYLMCLWHGQTGGVRFVDVGCGNGLLVYLLNSEGHCGKGYDLRRRKIWDTYPEAVRGALIEQPIIPSPGAPAPFPDTDWLIGNHSDELTPWLPLMAARSTVSNGGGGAGRGPNLFLLPCCPFDFDGFRFGANRTGGQSRYRDYLDYVGRLCSRVGFDSVRRDCLRIPSTRRVCFVATGLRCQPPLSVAEACAIAGNVPADFEPRQREVETSRPPQGACAALPVPARRRIELALFHALLDAGEGDGDGDDVWHAGGTLPLSQLVGLLTEADRVALRRECGGLQTLLRSCHQAFCVRGGGLASIRRPMPVTSATEAAATDRQRRGRKTRACWMEANHPDGCPLGAGECAFRHACETAAAEEVNGGAAAE